jgi:hypothetical protein
MTLGNLPAEARSPLGDGMQFDPWVLCMSLDVPKLADEAPTDETQADAFFAHCRLLAFDLHA